MVVAIKSRWPVIAFTATTIKHPSRTLLSSRGMAAIWFYDSGHQAVPVMFLLPPQLTAACNLSENCGAAVNCEAVKHDSARLYDRHL